MKIIGMPTQKPFLEWSIAPPVGLVRVDKPIAYPDIDETSLLPENVWRVTGELSSTPWRASSPVAPLRDAFHSPSQARQAARASLAGGAEDRTATKVTA